MQVQLTDLEARMYVTLETLERPLEKVVSLVLSISSAELFR